MKNPFSLLAILIIFIACSASRSHIAILPGVEGYIYLLKGNQMPSPGKKASRGKGVGRIIIVYAPTRVNDVTGEGSIFISINSRLITQAKSDSTGHYKINLPAGRYSIFIKENGSYFANEIDGGGYLNLVEVKKGSVTKKDFQINNSATY